MRAPFGTVFLDRYIEKALRNYVTIPEDVIPKGQHVLIEPNYSVLLAFHVGDT